MEGFITLNRKLLEWEWHDDPYMVSLWVHLLLMASHKDVKYHGIVIQRGQLATTRKDLAEAVGLTTQQLRTRLAKLEQDGSISQKSTNQVTIITICKYDDYQTKKAEDDNQVTNEQQTNNKRITNADLNNNENNKLLYNSNGAYVHTHEGMSESQEALNGRGAVTEDSVPEMTAGWVERIQMMIYQIYRTMLSEDDVRRHYEEFKSRQVDPFLLTTEQDWWQHYKNYLLKKLDNNATGKQLNRDEQRQQEATARMQGYAEVAAGMQEYVSELSRQAELL